MPRGEQFDLQRTLAFVSFFYFTYSAGRACLVPFLTLYFRQLGLSATQTGIICGLKAFVALWAAPLWSRCAAQYGRQRIILMVAIFMTIASNLGLTLLPPADEELYFAFCNPGNNSDKQGLMNNSDINGNHYVGSAAPFMQTPLTNTEVTITPRNQVLIPSTTVKSMIVPSSQLPSSEPNQDITSRPTTERNSFKPTTLHFKPSKKLLSDSDHADMPHLQSPGPNAHKTSGVHNARPKPVHLLPVSKSQEVETPTDENWLEQYEPSKDQFPDNLYHSAASKHKWNDFFSNDFTNAPEVNPWKSLQTKGSRLQGNGPLAEENTAKPETVLNWGNVQGEKSPDKGNGKPNTRPNIHTSTTHFGKFGSSVGPLNRGVYRNIAKRSASAEPEQDDQLPRSLESARESLSKTMTNFLELEQLTFILALLIVVIGGSVSCPVDKICDSSLHETLDSIDELDKYKRHHVPSLIGYGLFALIVTLIVENTNCRIFLQASHFMVHFYMFAGLLGLTFLLAFFYPIPAPRKGSHKLRFCKGLKLLVADPHNTMVTVTMVVAGVLASNIHNFLFWHVQDLGGSEVIMGVAVLVSIISHIPMLFVTNWLTRKLSQAGMLVLALVCLSTRLLYFTFLWTPWAVVPIEILCAFSQQALWETATSYGEQISPPAMDRSVKSILNSLYHGLGFAIGSTLGGVIFDQAGLKVLYGSSAGMALVWGVVVALVTRFVPKKRKLHYSSLLRREDDDEEEYLSDEDSDEVYGNDWLVKALKDDF